MQFNVINIPQTLIVAVLPFRNWIMGAMFLRHWEPLVGHFSHHLVRCLICERSFITVQTLQGSWSPLYLVVTRDTAIKFQRKGEHRDQL